MSLLSVHNLSLTISKKKLLSSITFNANSGTTVVILGPNGAGKTTLLKSIIGLYQTPKPGAAENIINFDGYIINAWPVHKRVEHGLLYLPQTSSLFQHMNVHDNLHVVYQYHPFWQQQPFEHFKELVDQLLTQTHLSSMLHSKAGILSGGQKRKLEVVRSLLMKPKMLLLDEPFAGVDPKSIYELKSLFSQLSQQGIGIVISDHHVDQLLSIAHQAYVIMEGQVVTSGSIQEILEDTHTKERYLGTQFYQEISQRFLHR